MENIDIEFRGTHLRPKAKAGPARGLSSWILFIIVLGATEMAFWIILKLELVNLDQLEIWIAASMLGILASLIYWCTSSSIFNQGRKSAMQGMQGVR